MFFGSRDRITFSASNKRKLSRATPTAAARLAACLSESRVVGSDVLLFSDSLTLRETSTEIAARLLYTTMIIFLF